MTPGRLWVFALGTAFLLTGCGKRGAEATSGTLVPFTFFNTPQHSIQLEFDVNRLRSALWVDQRRFDLVNQGIVLKVVELPTHRLAVFGKTIFDGEVWLTFLDLSLGTQYPIALPPSLREALFRDAAPYDDTLLCVFYDVRGTPPEGNKLYRIFLTPHSPGHFDPHFQKRLAFDSDHDINIPLFMRTAQGRLFVCAAQNCHVYGRAPSGLDFTETFKVGTGYRLLEMVSDGTRLVGLYHKTPDSEGETAFVLYDLSPVGLSPENPIPTDGIPYDVLLLQGRVSFSRATQPQDAPALFLATWRNMNHSGVMDLGANDSEGRVAWSLVYYLNAFIDILSKTRTPTASLAPLREPLRRRLDLEVTLLDRLFDPGNPGLLARRYSLQREPLIFAGHSGRVLKVLKKYRNEIDSPITLPNLAKLQGITASLEGHVDVLTAAGPDDRWALPGTYFLQIPRGRPVTYDGTRQPFNLQNAWAEGVVYSSSEEELTKPYALAAKEMVETFLRLEKIRSDPSPSFEWNYNWGELYEGWTEEQNISLNTPKFGGYRPVATSGYRSMDAVAVLTLARSYANLIDGAVVDYFKRAIEAEKLMPYVEDALSFHGVNAKLSKRFSDYYLRISDPADWENFIWAIEDRWK